MTTVRRYSSRALRSPKWILRSLCSPLSLWFLHLWKLPDVFAPAKIERTVDQEGCSRAAVEGFDGGHRCRGPISEIDVPDGELNLGRWEQECCLACEFASRTKAILESQFAKGNKGGAVDGCYDRDEMYYYRAENGRVETWRRRREGEEH